MSTSLKNIEFMNNEKPFKPYIVNAFYNWALDNNKTPYIQVSKDLNNKLPSYLKEQPFLIFRLHSDSINNLEFSENSLDFIAYFKGYPYEITIPYQNIRSIFCKENSYGLNFDIEENIYEDKNPNTYNDFVNKKSNKTKLTLIEGGEKS